MAVFFLNMCSGSNNITLKFSILFSGTKNSLSIFCKAWTKARTYIKIKCQNKLLGFLFRGGVSSACTEP